MPVVANSAFRFHFDRLAGEIAERSEDLKSLLRGEWRPEWDLGAGEHVFTVDQADEEAIVRVLRSRMATCPAAGMAREWLRAEAGLSRPRLVAAIKRLQSQGRVTTRQNLGTWLADSDK